jgi:RNA polymerase sigma-70 factor (ECF subfamily)
MSPADNEEKQLILRAQKGEMGAFEELVYRYDREVLALAIHFTQSQEEAKDIYQEVFLRVFNALRGFRFESRFSTWLYRITANVCFTQAARAKRRNSVPIEDEYVEQDGRGVSGNGSYLEPARLDNQPMRAAMSKEIGERIRSALEGLSAQQRLVFTLRHYQGHKLKEIAEILNCAEGTVKKHLFNATARLRNELSRFYA